MQLILKKLVIISFLIIVNSNLHAENPYFLDFKFILNESEAGKKAQAQLKNKLDKGIKSIREKEKNLQDEERKIIKQKKLLKPDEYKVKVDKLRSQVSSLQKERNTLLESTARQRNIARNELLKNLNPIIKTYMKEKKIRMVIDKKSLLLADDNLNITKDIMDRLNKQLKTIKLN
jgi:outer membrane protein